MRLASFEFRALAGRLAIAARIGIALDDGGLRLPVWGLGLLGLGAAGVGLIGFSFHPGGSRTFLLGLGLLLLAMTCHVWRRWHPLEACRRRIALWPEWKRRVFIAAIMAIACAAAPLPWQLYRQSHASSHYNDVPALFDPAFNKPAWQPNPEINRLWEKFNEEVRASVHRETKQ